jgi:diguanylate cyclase (GGDEF)-like protein
VQPGEATTYATWQAELWSTEPLLLQAFRSLLGVDRTIGAADEERLERLFERSATAAHELTDQLGRRRYEHSLAIVFIDLDNFKQLNDTRGHSAGDAALRVTANALHTKLRLSDSVARLGGDEFAIVLPEIDYAAAVDAGRKISAAIRTALADYPPVTASVGVAWFNRACPRFDTMVAAADRLMYEVKQGGKGDFVARRLSTETC